MEPIHTDNRPQTGNWVRWVLLAPAAVGAAGLAYFAAQLLGLIASLVGLSAVGQYFVFQVTGSILQPIAFVLVGAQVAPTSRYCVALVLTAFYVLVMVAVFAADPPSGTLWVIVATSVLGVGAAIGAAYRLRAKEQARPL